MEQKSKYLAYLLRHHPEKANIILDKYGYASLENLEKDANISLEDIENIIKTSDKQRYVFNLDKTKIKACQGHSFPIELEIKTKIPEKYLFHGTSRQSIDIIMKEGLDKMSRQHVHLSTNPEDAYKIGGRHGSPVVLKIDALLMYKNGFKFYQAENNVWLTDNVPNTYLSIVDKETTIHTPCAGVIVFNQDKTKVALVKAQYWGFPKGKIEKGEDYIKGAFRELFEETSIQRDDIEINDISKVFIELSVKGKPAVKFLTGIFIKNDREYLLKCASGFEDELQEVKWISISDAQKLLVTKNRRELLDKALSYCSKVYK